MSESNFVEQLDAAIARFFVSWNAYTVILGLIAVVILVYPLLTGQDPDVHPFLLARQSQPAPIRHEGESAVYRAVDIPYGYPLRAGLGVKDVGAPKWTAGRNGDIRDVWRQAVRGPTKDDGTPTGSAGKIVTVLGREKVIEHQLHDLTREINVIGQYVQEKGARRVAICLSNSVELIAAIFAGAFYDFSPILIPYGLSSDKIISLLQTANADLFIAEAGTLELSPVLSATKTIKNVIWVVQESSRHMDWKESAGSVAVETWHELVEQQKTAVSSDPLPVDKDSKVPPLAIFCTTDDNNYELIEYSSENLISGVAALNAALGRAHKFSPTDTLLLTTSLASTYSLSLTLSALYSNASLALNSVAGPSVDLTLATTGITPTVVVAGTSTMQSFNSSTSKSATSLPGKVSRYFATQTLQSGVMPSKRPSTAISAFSSLRLLLIDQPTTAGGSTSKLTSSQLSDLRITLGTRIGYALTSPRVAGAVAQTNILDYRNKKDVVCVGPPLGSVEVSVTGEEGHVGTSSPRGKIVVKGPAVVGGKVVLDTVGIVDDDHTLVLP